MPKVAMTGSRSPSSWSHALYTGMRHAGSWNKQQATATANLPRRIKGKSRSDSRRNIPTPHLDCKFNTKVNYCRLLIWSLAPREQFYLGKYLLRY